MNEQERHELFSDLVVKYQNDLYVYIFSIVRDWQDADDLFQSVCLVLWSKFEQFQPGTSFFAWARQTAKFTVRNFLRQKQSKRFATEELASDLAKGMIEHESDETESYLTALRSCKEKLAPPDQDLLEFCYVDGLGSHEIAERLDRPQRSVSNSLLRIHQQLFRCIRSQMAQMQHPRGGNDNE